LFSFTTRVSIDGSHIHGIFPGMLEDAPVFLDAVGNFIEFAEDSLPVAHNAPFDAKFLQSEFQHAGLIWPDMVVLDSLRAARRLLKGHSSYSLASLTRDLGMEFEGVAHCALADARMTSKLMAVLLERTEPRTWPSPPAWPLVTHRGLLKAR
jgi:DNA polymerase III epsilon subunit-like protein